MNVGHWVRKRCYNKVHVRSWTIFLEKDGYVKCSFQNCKFMAFDVDEMAEHFSLCGGNNCSDVKYICPVCDGYTVSNKKLQYHMARAHNIEPPDQAAAEDDNEERKVTTRKKPLTKVLKMSWVCLLDKNKYLKCSDCSILASDVEYFVKHYTECKKVPLLACYICEDCKGRALDFNFLACHRMMAHDKAIDYRHYNVITEHMVRFWDFELKRKSYSYCLHKTNGENDCLFFETDIISLILHCQSCQAEKPLEKYECNYCGCWTPAAEKLEKHLQICHSDSKGKLIFAIEPAVEPAVELSDEPAVEPAVKPAVEPAVKPAVEPAVKPAVEPAVKPAFKEESTEIENTIIGYNIFDEVEEVEHCSVTNVSGSEEHSSQDLVLKGDVDDPSIIHKSRSSDNLRKETPRHREGADLDHFGEYVLPTVESIDENFQKGLNSKIEESGVYSDKQISEEKTSETNNDLVLSKSNFIEKDGTNQVFLEKKNETNKSEVQENDILHLKDGCTVEIICQRSEKSNSSTCNLMNNEFEMCFKLQLSTQTSNKCDTGINKERSELNVLDKGNNNVIEDVQNFKLVENVPSQINSNNDNCNEGEAVKYTCDKTIDKQEHNSVKDKQLVDNTISLENGNQELRLNTNVTNSLVLKNTSNGVDDYITIEFQGNGPTIQELVTKVSNLSKIKRKLSESHTVKQNKQEISGGSSQELNESVKPQINNSSKIEKNLYKKPAIELENLQVGADGKLQEEKHTNVSKNKKEDNDIMKDKTLEPRECEKEVLYGEKDSEHSAFEINVNGGEKYVINKNTQHLSIKNDNIKHGITTETEKLLTDQCSIHQEVENSNIENENDSKNKNDSKTISVSKRKRGRPSKQLSNNVSRDDENLVDCNSCDSDSLPIESNEESNLNNKKQTPTHQMEVLQTECLSSERKKRGRPRKQLVPVESIDIKLLEVENKSLPVNDPTLSSAKKMITLETHNMNVQQEQLESECLSSGKKKRGRPHKRKLEETVSLKSDLSTKKEFKREKLELCTDVSMGVEKVYGRKNKGTFVEERQNLDNNSRFETPDNPTSESTCFLNPVKKRGRPKKNIPCDGKTENKEPNNEKKGNSSETNNLSASSNIDNSETSNALPSNDVDDIDQIQTLVNHLQPHTSHLAVSSETKKPDGSNGKENITALEDDNSVSDSTFYRGSKLKRTGIGLESKSVSKMNASHKWYLHPNDAADQVRLPKRRGRSEKTNDNMFVHFMAFDQDSADTVTEENQLANEVKKKKVGRPPKYRRPQNSAVQCRIQLKGNIMVKCGRCGEEMSKLEYQTAHEIRHNYMCWLEGDPPIDLDDKNAVLRVLNSRRNKKLPFKCEECGMTKKSAVGFQSHIQFCGKSPEEREALMLRCEICGRLMMPASLKVHMGLAHNPKKPALEEQQLTFVKARRTAASKAESSFQEHSESEGESEQTPKRKRSSPSGDDSFKQLYSIDTDRLGNGKLAIWKKHIREKGFGECYHPGCGFVSESVKILQDHFKNCKLKPEKVYSCRKCQYFNACENTMVDHVTEKHIALLNQDNQSSYSSESEGENNQSNSDKKSYPKLKFIQKLSRQQKHKYLHQALSWTYELRLKMCPNVQIFQEFQYKASDWIAMSDEAAKNYLPLTKTSVPLKVNNQDWKQLELFESAIMDDTPIMFVGGPVWACAWAPVPNTVKNQYLAVACHPDMDAEHAMGCTYTYKSVIQIWDMGSLCNIKNPPFDNPPHLMLVITHSHGAVWALEWCESGCFNASQLGLIAAACSDDSVVIYSIPRQQPSKNHTVYEVKPVAVLKLGCEMLTQCMRIAWHKASPHNILAGGFANGMVAVWDLNTTSSLLRSDETIFPYCVFQAHNSSITGLSFGPDEGARYISTASADRANKFWDLQDTTAPISVNRKGVVTDSIWLTHWLCSVSIYDDIYGHGITNLSLFSYRDFFFQPYPLAPQIAVNWSLTFCEWLNAVGTCDEIGRVSIAFPLQLIHMVDKKGKKKIQNVILTSVQDFGDIEEVSSLHNAGDNKSKKTKQKVNNKKEGSSFLEKTFETDLNKYSTVASRFGLSLTIDKKNLGLNMPEKKIDPANYINSYPLSSINKVSWNPNYRSFQWLAAGYQCGLVVVPHIDCIRTQDLETFYTKNDTFFL